MFMLKNHTLSEANSHAGLSYSKRLPGTQKYSPNDVSIALFIATLHCDVWLIIIHLSGCVFLTLIFHKVV